MATDTNRKIYVPLRLPSTLVNFLDDQAKSRFTTRNEIIQSLVVDAYRAAANAK